MTYQMVEYLDHLTVSDRQLLDKAKSMLDHAYAPYSQFYVASAVRLQNGLILCGTNQENASYPLSLCAERVALLSAKANHPKESIDTIAIVAKIPKGDIREIITPCGACRQVIAEVQSRQNSPIRLLLNSSTEISYIIDDALDLLPLGFHSGFLT